MTPVWDEHCMEFGLQGVLGWAFSTLDVGVSCVS
jgi:hypothetical protein